VKGELPAGYERIFRYALREPEADVAAEAAAYRPPFAHLALLLQLPGVDVAARLAAEKGSPLTDRERAILDERIAAARAWLERYAPESARIEVRFGALPDEARMLPAEERRFLAELAATIESDRPTTGEAWQARIFEVAGSVDLPSGRAFAALYLAFLGRRSGPRAGWLLASLELGFVVARLREAAGEGSAPPSGGRPEPRQ
jgi:lysyl-tRNA synthetase class 1